MMHRLDGKTVAVFGATGLIGRAIVAEAVSRGAKVIALGRSEAKLNELPVEGSIEPRQIELGGATGSDNPFDDIDRLDFVLTPVGGPLIPLAFANSDPTAITDAFSAKLMTQIEAVHLALPYLAKDGTIVLFSGMLSRDPVHGLSTMSAVNAAVEGLTRALAIELAPIVLRCISPTLVVADTHRKAGDGSITPEAVARTALRQGPSGAIVDVLHAKSAEVSGSSNG